MPHPGKSSGLNVDRTIQIVSMLLILGVFVVQVVQVSGGGSTHTILARAEAALKDYPQDQLGRSVHATLETLENFHQISARTKFLMDHIQPEQVKKLAERANAVSDEDIRNTMNVLSNLNRLLATVNAEDLGKMVTNMRAVSEHINATRMNQLIDSANAIEERLKGLNEIRVKF